MTRLRSPERRGLSRRAALAAAPFVIALPGLALTGAGAGAAAGATGPATVVAQWSSPATGKTPVLELISAASGQLEGRLGALPGSPTSVTGPFAGPGGSLWYSTNRGPEYRCPKVCMEAPVIPDSCRSTVSRLLPGRNAGAAQVVVRAAPSVQLEGGAPSPQGTSVVYAEQGCTSFMDWHYVVRSLGTTVTAGPLPIGATDAACHSSSLPSWSPDGSHLAFTWGPSVLVAGARPPGGGAAGPICPQPRRSELAVVPADKAGPVAPAELHPAPAGCSYVAAAYDLWGIAVVRDCGGTGGGDWLGKASLVQLSPALTVLAKFSLPPQPDGVTLSADADGRHVLVDEYEAPGSVPIEWLIEFNGRGLRTIRRDATGAASIEYATWYTGPQAG